MTPEQKILAALNRKAGCARKLEWLDVVLEMAAATHGRYFVGIERPKGYRRQMAAKACFRSAGMLAVDGKGQYVEGFAMSANDEPFAHAWITSDGAHAIDPTLKGTANYVGITVPLKSFEKNNIPTKILGRSRKIKFRFAWAAPSSLKVKRGGDDGSFGVALIVNWRANVVHT